MKNKKSRNEEENPTSALSSKKYSSKLSAKSLGLFDEEADTREHSFSSVRHGQDYGAKRRMTTSLPGPVEIALYSSTIDVGSTVRVTRDVTSTGRYNGGVVIVTGVDQGKELLDAKYVMDGSKEKHVGTSIVQNYNVLVKNNVFLERGERKRKDVNYADALLPEEEVEKLLALKQINGLLQTKLPEPKLSTSLSSTTSTVDTNSFDTYLMVHLSVMQAAFKRAHQGLLTDEVREIFQLDANDITKVVRKWKNLKQAGYSLDGTNPVAILRCSEGIRSQAGGFKWVLVHQYEEVVASMASKFDLSTKTSIVHGCDDDLENELAVFTDDSLRDDGRENDSQMDRDGLDKDEDEESSGSRDERIVHQSAKQNAKSKCKEVFQCNLEGELIKQWASITKAATALGMTTHSGISDCINGRQNTAGGFKWARAKYVEVQSKYVPDTSSVKSSSINRVPVFQLALDGAGIKQWASITKAATALGMSISNISDCLYGRQNTAGGFKWVRAHSKRVPDISIPVSHHANSGALPDNRYFEAQSKAIPDVSSKPRRKKQRREVFQLTDDGV